MCIPRISLGLAFLCLNIAVAAQQQTPGSQSSTDPTQSQSATATKDPQAVSVVNQALRAGGGLEAIKAITDYVATGNITYPTLDHNQSVQGTVTVRAQGLNSFRMDTTLPSGQRSEVINGKWQTKDEKGGVLRIPILPPLGPARLVLPYLQLRFALTSQNLNLVDKGLVEVDGKSLRDIQVQRIFPNTRSVDTAFLATLNIDFFIDPSTFQIVMMQDIVSKVQVRQFRYSNFTLVNGVSVPFSITESIHSQAVWLMQLDKIDFNSGLQTSDFQL